MEDIKNTVRQFVRDNFMLGAQQQVLADADSFLERHLIDSTGFIELVSFLEETYGIKIDDAEMVPDNLDSVEQIGRFIAGRRAA